MSVLLHETIDELKILVQTDYFFTFKELVII